MQPYPYSPNDPQQSQPSPSPREPGPPPIHRPIPEEPTHRPVPEEPTSPPEREPPPIDASAGSSRAQLIETSLEQRDGGLWVTGQCSRCSARLACLVSDAPHKDLVACPNGHTVVVHNLRSACRTRARMPNPAFDPRELRGERSETPQPPSCGSSTPIATSSPRVGASQPDESTWQSTRPFIGPPRDGQPQAGSKR